MSHHASMHSYRIQGARGGATLLLWMVAILCCGIIPGAATEGGLSLEVNNVEWQGGPRRTYSVFETVSYAQSATLTVKNNGSPQHFFVTFSSNSGNAPLRKAASGGDELGYQIYDTAGGLNVLKDLPGATSTEVLQGVFGAGEIRKTLNFVVSIPAQQAKPPGQYVDKIRVTLYQGTLGSYTEEDSSTISISARVAELVEVAVLNQGESFRPEAVTKALDFGILTEGKSLGFDLRVRSNAGYQMTLESEGGWRLKHSSGTDPSKIPYNLSINGIVANTSGESAVVLARKHVITSAQGDSYPCVVTIGTVDGASAGIYRDNILLTVATHQ